MASRDDKTDAKAEKKAAKAEKKAQKKEKQKADLADSAQFKGFDMTRTVNGTGHTGPSEFCATSI